MNITFIAKFSMVLVICALVASCGDPIFSIKHTVNFEGSISHNCILTAAKAVNVRAFPTKNSENNFDEYLIVSGETEIYALLFRDNRNKIELSTFGIGFADKERDLETCKLIYAFKNTLIDTCIINRNTIIINEEYIRSNCEK